MPKTFLAELVERQVQSAVVSTFSQTAATVAQELAADLLNEPEFREHMRQLVRAAFHRALQGLADAPSSSGPSN